MEVRGLFEEIGPHLTPYGSQESNSDCRDWQQVPSSAEPAHRLYNVNREEWALCELFMVLTLFFCKSKVILKQ